jgi:urease accessory protein
MDIGTSTTSAWSAPSGALITAFLLADGRTPTGGHAHSGGAEAAVANGLVSDLDTLHCFLEGRLWTGGLIIASLAATACRLALGDGDCHSEDQLEQWRHLDAEADARVPSLAQRATARRLGRHLLRTAEVAWPAPLIEALSTQFEPAPHHALVVGAVCGCAGAPPTTAAAVAAHGSVTGPASAVVRLLGLDPIAVTAVLTRLGSALDQVVERAARSASGPVCDLPAPAAPLSDLLSEQHATWKEALFAS